MIRSGWGITAALYLLLCLLLGGASAAGAIANGLLQILAVGLIVAALWTKPDDGRQPAARSLIWLALAFAAYVLLTLVPLPASLWSGLPFREHVASGYRLMGMELPSIPLSLARSNTVASLLSLLPPAAVFLMAVRLGHSERRALALLVVVFACLSIILGAFQLVGGEGSPLRFYEITNRGRSVGFFSNANHLVTLLLCAIPLVGFLAARGRRRSSSDRGGHTLLMLSFALGVFLLVGILIARSLAGYGLLLPAGLAAFLVYKRSAGSLRLPWLIGGGVVVAVFVVLAMAGPLNDQSLSEKEGSASSRAEFAENTLDAIADSFPAGTGLGSFQTVYRLYEDPERNDRSYTNHAHDDYLEIVLELGIAGILFVLLFIAWWIRRSITAWFSDFEGAGLARASSAIVLIVLLHSLADYPIRTSAIAAVVALACAFLVLPPVARRKPAETETAPSGGLRHLEADW
jgi:O-antigen ligase